MTATRTTESVVIGTGDPTEMADMAVRLTRAWPGQHVVYERAGVYRFAAAPAAEIVTDAHTVRVRTAEGQRSVPANGDPLGQTGKALAALGLDAPAYGWAAFELAHVLHGTGTPAGPLLHLMVPGIEVRCAGGTATARAADLPLLDQARATLGRPTVRQTASVDSVDVSLDSGAHAYRDAVRALVRDIARGRLLKAVPSRTVPVPVPVDLAATYLAGRAANTPARSFLLALGGWRVAGFSPETVAEVDADGRVTTQPLAGTRRLDTDPVANERLRAELLADPKEVHEHAVSVQLSCAELDSVCAPGTVAVRDFMTVRERGSVQHLASRVSGRLTTSAWHAFAALFPAVTATGVGKPEALRALAHHETGPRGLYGGSVFTVDRDGSLDAALVLRSVFTHEGRTWLRAGAGVVAQSDPDRELEETREKLRSVAPHLRTRTPREDL